jgi:RND superfamily putative drug exporter
VSLLPAAAACGLCVLVFQDGHLAGAINQSGQGALETGAVASLLAALVSVSAARSAAILQASRDAESLGLEPGWAGYSVASMVVPGAIVATVIAAAATGVLAGAVLSAAREFGLAVSVGLLIDLLVLRPPLIAALARWGPG